MKKLFTSLAITAFVVASSSLISTAQNSYTAKKDITLSFNNQDDGTNACAVTWNPERKLYYSVIAGNALYPLETFASGGKQLFYRESGFDARGLWYNSKTGKLEGNAAGEEGLFALSLASDGKPGSPENVYTGQKQPDFQSVGAFDPAKQIIYFYLDGTIYSYKRKGGKASKTFVLKDLPTSVSDINSTTVVFTGRKGEELGVLDFNANRVYLYDLKGNYKAKVTLPSDALTHDMFRFSFANGKIWLYDTESRTWTGYAF